MHPPHAFSALVWEDENQHFTVFVVPAWACALQLVLSCPESHWLHSPSLRQWQRPGCAMRQNPHTTAKPSIPSPLLDTQRRKFYKKPWQGDAQFWWSALQTFLQHGQQSTAALSTWLTPGLPGVQETGPSWLIINHHITLCANVTPLATLTFHWKINIFLPA